MQYVKIIGVQLVSLVATTLSLVASVPTLGEYEMTLLDMRGDLIRDIEVHPLDSSIVYLIGQNGGVYKSVDSGATWRHLLRIDGRGLGIDHSAPDTVYAGGLGGMYKTTDGGETWTKVLQGVLRSVGVHPVSGVVFGGGQGLIWRSEDGGSTWTQPVSATLGEINKWAFHPGNSDIVYHSAAKNYGIYKSTDGGTTWREVLKEYGRAVAISPSNPEILYSSQHKSVDGGETWTPTGGGQAWAVAIHPNNPDIVYKATQGDAVFMTVNGGKYWAQMKGLTRGGKTDLSAHWSIACDGEKDILYLGAAVLYKADNASSRDSWLYESSVGITSPDVVSITGTSDVLWIGTDGQGVSRSDDHGQSWERKLLGLRGKLNLGALVIHPLDNNTIYSAGEGGLVKTDTAGDIWLHLPKPGTVRSVAVDPADKFGVFTITDGKIYKSGDGGMIWAEWRSAPSTNCLHHAIHPFKPQSMFVQTSLGWKRTSDGGASWVDITMPGDGVVVLGLSGNESGALYFIQSGTQIHRSVDDGYTWELLLGGLQYRGMAETPDGVLWVLDRAKGVYRSIDGGETWELRNVGMETRRMLLDPLNPRAVYIAAKGGLYHLHPVGESLPPPPPEPPPQEPPEFAVIPISAPGILDRPNTLYQLTADISSPGTAFFVTADNITIDGQGHTVEFNISAVEAIAVSNLTVRNMIAVQPPTSSASSHGVTHAFDMMFCPNVKLEGLTISTSIRPVGAISIVGENAMVVSNVVSSIGPFATAVTVEGKGAQVIGNNLDATNSGCAISVADAERALIIDNLVSYGGPTTVSGVKVLMSPDSLLRGNTIGGRGYSLPTLDIRDCERITVEANDISANAPFLLRLSESSNSAVTNNSLSPVRSNPAIGLESSNNCSVDENTIAIDAAAAGILVVLDNSSGNAMSGNKLNNDASLSVDMVELIGISRSNSIDGEKINAESAADGTMIFLSAVVVLRKAT